MRKTKDVALKSAEMSEDGGSITAYASTFDREPDSYGDVIAKGAFAGTLARHEESGEPILFLWGHDVSDPYSNLGTVESAEEDERGLKVTCKFDADSQRAQYVRKMVNEGRVTKLSFAYDVIDQKEVELEGGVKANELRELELYEVSLVAIPANRHAEVIESKAGRRNSSKDEKALRDVRASLSEAIGKLDAIIGDSGDEGAREDNDEAAGGKSEDPDGAKYADLIGRIESIR